MAKILNWLFKGKHRKKIEQDTKIPKHKFNIKKDKEDHRDFKLCNYVQTDSTVLLDEVDLSPYVPPIKNQGSIGSCGSMTAVTGLETLYNMKGHSTCELSELFHYYEVRQPSYGNTFPSDSGQCGRDAMKVLNQVGTVPEKLFPYETQRFNTPPKLFGLVKSLARFWRTVAYYRCNNVYEIKHALSNKLVVWCGLPVQSSIRSYKTGIITWNQGESLLGGHAMLIVGYNDNKGFKIINSWGTEWGQAGTGWLDYDYFEKCPWFDCWSMDIK